MNKKGKAGMKQLYMRQSESLSDHVVATQDIKRPIVALPEITTSPKFKTVRRYVNNGGSVSGNLTLAHLLDQFMIATSSTVGVSYLRALRIRKIRILSPVQTQGTSITLRLQPVGLDSSVNNFNSLPETYIDTSASIDVPAYISLKPTVESPLGSWHYAISTNTSQNLLYITCPQGSTMDIQFEYIMNDQNIVSNYTNSLSAASAGALYSRNILTNFVPLVFITY